MGMITAILGAVVSGVDYFTEDLTAGDFLGQILVALYFTMAVAVLATTIGKRLFGLYVKRTDGSRVGGGRALVRCVMYSVSAIIFFVGFIMIALQSDKRGLHGLICDTRVVRQ